MNPAQFEAQDGELVGQTGDAPIAGSASPALASPGLLAGAEVLTNSTPALLFIMEIGSSSAVLSSPQEVTLVAARVSQIWRTRRSSVRSYCPSSPRQAIRLHPWEGRHAVNTMT